MGHPNIWGHLNICGRCPNIWGIQTYGASKHMQGIQTYGGVQTYRGHSYLIKWVLPLVLLYYKKEDVMIQ